MNSIKANYIYNALYQLLLILTPLITLPYISRVLGVEGIGIHSYTHSIAIFFALFAMLGFDNYGNRMIAKCRDDKKKLSYEFSSLYIYQMFTSILSIIIFIIYIHFFGAELKQFLYLQLLLVISSMFNVNWFFWGMEKFKLTVMRSTIVKVLATASIFIFVNSSNDVGIYILILTLSVLIRQLSIWVMLRRYVKFKIPNLCDLTKHIKPSFILFVPVVSISLYQYLNRVMLGNLSSISELGLYESAMKLIGVPLVLINALGVVMLPRMSNLVAQDDKDKFYKYISKSIEIISFFAVASMFGLMAIAVDFSYVFFGEAFIRTGHLVQWLALTILFVSVANVIRTQYLLPKEKDKIIMKSNIYGAVVSICVNMLLIPRFHAMGAVIGNISVELFVMSYVLWAARKELPIVNYLKHTLKLLIPGLIMFFAITSLKQIIPNIYVLIFVQVIIGGLLYGLLNIRFVYRTVKKTA